ncbi:DUF885 domain-containing protein [uncultured Hyphomonas sp.]|uniref:DUF885 domain-containing protein n=1 Tax=uncultured Hyphomonas sp. TaxID=225298 RepID=UPI0026202DB7|nr:DUF885 domain-containing protein [uncultured Hyphomonas sp.]
MKLRFPASMRSVFQGAFSGLAVLSLAAACTPAVDDAGTPRRIARQVDDLMASIAANELADNPEMATRLGLSEDATGYDFNAYLTDRSQAAFERTRVKRLEILEALLAAPRPVEGGQQARHLDTVIQAYETAESLFVAGHGQTGLGHAYPYVADHMRGAYIDVPDLLTGAHPFGTAQDARDYVSRLAQLPGALQDERRRLQADARAGIVPPVFVLERMQTLAETSGAGPAEAHLLVTTFNNLASGADGLSLQEQTELAARVDALVRNDVLPAYAEFAAALEALMDDAPEEPGVWQLPGGDVYYDAALTAYTDEGITAEALHAQGLAEVAQLTEELMAALEAQELVEGTLTERLAALSLLDGQLYEDTPEGREALLARMRTHMVRAETNMAEIMPGMPRTGVTIRAVPDFLQASAPSAFYSAAPANGSAPAQFEINLSDMTDWPDFMLATLVFHETIPGHHLESALTAETANLPLIRQMIWNVAYGEGWAVYGEILAHDRGLYTDDPLGRIGFLQSMLFRAARLVADTGMHRDHWTRQQAIDYLAETTGQSPEAMAQEVDRYAVWPGQAAAYWVGAQRILDLRERSQRVLGPDFDLAEFHAVVLGGGPRPLSLLERDVERWYISKVDLSN